MPSDISDMSVPQDVELEQALGNGLQLALMELDVDGLYLFPFSYLSSQGILILERLAKCFNSLVSRSLDLNEVGTSFISFLIY